MKGATPARHNIRPENTSINALPIFARVEEMEELRQRLARRQSFLFHGPSGARKTLLLWALLPEFRDILYRASNPTPQSLYRGIAELLLAARHPVLLESCLEGAATLQTKSAVALKGLLRHALLNSGYLVVLDHLRRPSQSLAAAIGELMLSWSVPVVAVTRSAHMEDAGFILPLFADRTAKLGLRNFNADTARLFAAEGARKEGLSADNLPQFVKKVVEYSAGNPGTMLRMIRLAHDPRYLHGNQIKIAPLYIDHEIAAVSQ